MSGMLAQWLGAVVDCESACRVSDRLDVRIRLLVQVHVPPDPNATAPEEAQLQTELGEPFRLGLTVGCTPDARLHTSSGQEALLVVARS